MSARAAVIPRTGAPRVIAVVAGLTGINALGAAAGLITGPILARALGADGRGDLAAILVPFALAPYILSVGIPAYAQRELPRGRPVNEVVGSLAVPLVLLGLLGALAGVPIADALAEGRSTVRLLLLVAFATLPVLLPGVMLYACLGGLQRWRAVSVARLTPLFVALAADVVLYAIGRLTVGSAAAFTIIGALLGLLPSLPLLREGRPAFVPAIAREGLAFGARTWVGSLATIVNGRVDQLLMITVVAPRELGLYAVATTLAGASTLLVTAVAPPLMARISAGNPGLLPQALRMTLAAAFIINLLLALTAPLLLPLLFGSDFEGAVPMTIILLAAAVPLTGSGVLTAALQADGAPLLASMGEGIALVLTLAGLAVALRPWGGVGAAVVSLVSYSASFLYQLVMAGRRLGEPLRHFLLPVTADLRLARSWS